MTLPHVPITPIPNNEPDAVPSLWNERYVQIDQNFANLNSRVNASNTSLDALSSLTLHRSGETIIYNRGVVADCVVTRQSAGARNLSLAAGEIFMHGRSFRVAANAAAVTVPGNSGGASATCSVFLVIVAGVAQCQITALNVAMPANGLLLYTVAVPAGSVAVDGAFTLADVRRIEGAGWRWVSLSAAHAAIALSGLPDANYVVSLDVISCEGGRQQIGALEVENRLTNGFLIYLAGAADAVRVRHHVHRLI